ncbi:MAG TPA: hypothetical protein VJO35_01380 [Terriglobales bacterium]|nr:hypothetical protein [Terriglobales bacterium]
MKILCIHPQDEPEYGEWGNQSWDRVIDLGIGGAETYKRWSSFFHSVVAGLEFARTGHECVRNALTHLSGYLRDSQGVDWWEVLSVRYIERLYRIVAMQRLMGTLGGDDALFFTRPCFEARVVDAAARRPVLFASGELNLLDTLKQRYRKLQRLSCPQLRQIIPDKWDPKHRVRARFTRRQMPCARPVVLFPSAYVNVTRTALAYARMFPEYQFLLVVARRSGYATELPPNVNQVDLSAYVRRSFDSNECAALCSRWFSLRGQLESEPLLRLLLRTGALESLTKDLSHWLAVRNAWSEVFSTEPIESVFSCDENNPYTGIPLYIARQHGIPSVAAHHGALDGHRLLAASRADVFLAKGPMERDYLLSRCGLPRRQIEIGAPQSVPTRSGGPQAKSSIVFFSEDYEVTGARVDDFYRDVLRPLAGIARETGKELVLKLHPAESLRDRRRVLKRIFPDGGAEQVRIIDGPLTDNLLRKVWYAVTVTSTTGVDCAVRGIPVFFCGWLESWPFRYSEQFAKFRVGMRLNTPEEIRKIPELLRNYEFCDPSSLRQPIQHGVSHKIFSKDLSRLTAAV